MREAGKPTVCRLIFEFLPHVGGSVIHTIELSRHIDPFCRRQFLVVPRALGDTVELDKSFPFEIHRVPYVRLRLLSRLKATHCHWLPLQPVMAVSYGLCALPVIWRLHARHGIDVIHAHGVSAGAVATVAGTLLRRPVVWMVHGSLAAYSAAAGRYESLVTRLFRPRHAIVLDDGSRAPERFAALLGRDKVTIVLHAIDTDAFRPMPPDRALLARLGLEGKFVFFSNHNLIPVKGVKFALLAFRQFLETAGVPCALLVAGAGRLRDELRATASELGIAGQVVLTGTIDHGSVADHLAVSDVVLATSEYSNVNRSVQEAMACGRPVVAFDSGGTGRLVQHLKTGLLAESGKVGDLAEKMLLFYRDPALRQTLGEGGREFIARHRSWDDRVQTELGVYERVMRRGV